MTDAVATDLCALAARVETLTGPDREVDALICATMFTVVPYPPDAIHGRSAPLVYVSSNRFGSQWCDIPRYTASLDAAMSLVPDNCNWACCDLNEDNQPWACVTDQVDAVDHEGTAATVILAFVAAALRARAQQSGQDPSP